MILDQIVEDKKRRLPAHKARYSFETVRREAEEKAAIEEKAAADAQAAGGAGASARCPDTEAGAGGGALSSGARESFFAALKKPGLSIIGEFKQASPSLGNIKKTMELPERIAAYNTAVDAISCLTEEDHFHGNIDYFREIRSISTLPMIRKDFMIDEYQFYEAKMIGADAILLITAILDQAQMKAFYQLTRELNMCALVETHDAHEVERALDTGARIIGVNNRDLRDFTIRLETTRNLRPLVPEECCFVAESGITNDEELRFVKDCGIDAVLVGRAFMETDDPGSMARHWKAV